MNALDVGFHPSAWRSADLHPLSFVDAGHYRAIGRIAERGTLDAFFLADGPAIRDDPRQKPGRALDPALVLTAVAAATEHLGLIATASTTYNDPVDLAERLASLDALSGGRVGWNVVTTYHEGTAANFGSAPNPPRTERYRRAAEFVDVVTGLCRGTLDGGHRGEFLTVPAGVAVPPSPQGAPVVLQAGGSPQGRELAGRSADAVFSAEMTLDAGRRHAAEVRRHAVRHGRDPATVRILPGLVTVLGGTEAEAVARYEELESHLPPGYAARRIGSTLGVDVTAYPLDEPLPDDVLADPPDPASFSGSLGFREAVVRVARERRPTLRALLRAFGGYGHRILVGTPEQMADSVEEWFRAGAADGFNLMPDVLPSGVEAVVDHVVPLLRRRGLFRHEYRERTLRDRLGAVPAHHQEMSR